MRGKRQQAKTKRAPVTPAPAMPRGMSQEEFERLDAGDVVRNVATNELFFINQVRFPGFYVVARVLDEKTLEPVKTAMYPLRSGECLTLHSRGRDR